MTAMKYDGKESIDIEERKRLDVELSKEELHSFIKTLYYAKNGFSVGFSVLFNYIAANCSTKKEAQEALQNLGYEFEKAFDRYYSGSLKNESEFVDGVRVTHIKPAVKLN